ncbi:MAG: hypothetical protein IPI04_02880 [Ignavibacteria bacterium]|nr:hypothetical protein [Ignavibacteria bacterium]
MRCVILTERKSFLLGAGSERFQRKKLTFREAIQQRYNPLIKRIANLPKPVICAINGGARRRNIFMSGM